MSGQEQREEIRAELNSALSAWDGSRAADAPRDLDALDEAAEVESQRGENNQAGETVIGALGEARQRVENARADSESLIPEECEKWSPYKPAYIAYTLDGRLVWRCTHKKIEGTTRTRLS
jgi:hypothetical protein